MTGSPFILHRVASPDDGVGALAATHDGAIWCTLDVSGAIVRFTPGGDPVRIDLGDRSGDPVALASATDDSVWVTERAADRILRVDVTGVVWSSTVPTAAAGPSSIVGLDDGTAWFIEGAADAIGHVDILGRVAEFDTGVPGGRPAQIVSDGTSVWFSLPGARAIAHGRGGDSRPRLTRFDDELATPLGLAIGDDGCLWFSDPARGLIGRLARSGAVSEFSVPHRGSRPSAVAADSAGGCWFTMPGTGEVGHVDSDGHVAVVAIPDGSGEPRGVVVASSGTVWVALASGELAEMRDPAGLLSGIQ